MNTLPLSIQPLRDVAREAGLADELLIPYGRDKAKIELAALHGPKRGAGRLILVSAINPTPAGEGKTTTAIGLSMGLRRLGKKALLSLREPSLGPVFGVKGGGTGGGKASLHPADDINLHFTGDLHAITSAHNLLSALADNVAYHRQKLGDKGELDARLITWGRALDMNDRFLRRCILGLGGKAHGMPREARFDITAASEVMAILALARDYEDLATRLSRIVVGSSDLGQPITAKDVGAEGAMTALLRDALLPNLAQTDEGGPALVHCGPFANIAHGCSSLLATQLAMQLSDYAITEAGFGFDLGGEKFLDLKCRALGAWPRMVVLVATLRALKMHGGAPVKEASAKNGERLERGIAHLEKHLESAASFGLPAVVAINVFPDDSEEELLQVEAAAARLGARTARSSGFAQGGAGTLELARVVAEVADGTDAAPPTARYAYELEDALPLKLQKIAQTVYGAKQVQLTSSAEADLKRLTSWGFAGLPVCVAKTQLSLSDNAALYGRPRDFTVTVRELRGSIGAGFVVALTGEVMTMPGLPAQPAASKVRLQADGKIRGLMQND